MKNKFIEAILNEDEMGSVLRIHLHIEAHLEEYIVRRLPNPEFLKDLNPGYAEKVDLACCLGLDSSYRSSLKKLGRLRNQFAHNLDTVLDEKTVKELYSCLPQEARKAIEEAFSRTNNKHGSLIGESFQHISTKNRFSLFASLLSAFFLTDKEKIKSNNSFKADGVPPRP